MTKDTPDPASGEPEPAPEGEGDAVDLEAILGEAQDEEDAAEAAMDLSDLDELGVEGVVARMRGGAEDPEQDADDLAAAGLSIPPRPPRSPLISVIVLAAASYLLVTMFADFRYWLGTEPTDLGEASEWIARGGLDSPQLDGKYVVLRGVPDVQNRGRGARTKWAPTATSWFARERQEVRYLRITEGGGGLFAAVPRAQGDKGNTFEGRYEGRIQRLSADRAFPWLKQFFGDLQLTEPVDYPTQTWLGALRAAGPGAALDLEGVQVPADARVRVVSKTSDVRLQLGDASFTAQAAERAVADLGYPWLAQDPTATFHRFIARIPEGEREAAMAALQAQDEATSKNPADPSIGVVLFPLRAAYFAEVGMLSATQTALSFPYADNTTAPGYKVEGGKLVQGVLGDGTMSLPLGAIEAIRYERPVAVDPDGYIIHVGAGPSSERMAGILWLVVVGLAAVNVLSILVWLRRRAV